MDRYKFNRTSQSNAKISKNRKGTHGARKFAFEPIPSRRNRIATKLVQKMRHIIYEYSVRTGEQIVGLFIDKPNAPSRDYKIYGTKPLVNIMDDLKCSIDNKFKKKLKEEKKSTRGSVNPKLPLLTIDGNVTKLEYFTQSQLRKFIPYLIKYSAGRHYSGWNNSQFRPKWWPKDLAWFNVRYDMRTTEQKENESWTSTLQRIIKECYKYYGHEEMLQGLEMCSSTLPQVQKENPNNVVASTSANPDTEKMEVLQPVLTENIPSFHSFPPLNKLPTFESHLHNNVMYFLQTVGPATNILHPIHVVPVQTIHSENANSVSCANGLMNGLKQTANNVTLAQLNDGEVINETCGSANRETFANANIVQDNC